VVTVREQRDDTDHERDASINLSLNGSALHFFGAPTPRRWPKVHFPRAVIGLSLLFHP